MKILISKFSFKLFCLIILLSTNILSQSLTNLEKIYELIDTSAKRINLEIQNNSNPITLKYISPGEFKILEQRAFFAFSREVKNLLRETELPTSILNYTVDMAGINYTEVFKDGLFGDLYVERETLIKGSFFLENQGKILASEKFEYAATDTVNRDHINKIENISLPFTSSQVPPEPFFSGILEPAIAIGTAVVTVILFFTVRSK